MTSEHDIIKPSDDDHTCPAFDGAVCPICEGGLSVCRRCGKAEVELDEPCTPKYAVNFTYLFELPPEAGPVIRTATLAREGLPSLLVYCCQNGVYVWDGDTLDRLESKP